MSRLIGYGMLVLAALCALLFGYRVWIISVLTSQDVFNPNWKNELFFIFFGGIVAPLGFAALLLRKK